VSKVDGHFFGISQQRYQPTQVNNLKTGKELFKDPGELQQFIERPLIDPYLHAGENEFMEVS